MNLVGLSGYAGSGKDTAAEILADLGYERIAFADTLREFVAKVDPLVEGEHDHRETLPLSSILARHGWDDYKDTTWAAHIRVLLQRAGVAARETFGENVWIDAALGNLDPDGWYVITDVRFPNEAAAVRQRGGVLYRVHRTGVGPANAHISETALDDYPFDGTFYNIAGLDEFRDAVLGNFSIDPPGARGRLRYE